MNGLSLNRAKMTATAVAVGVFCYLSGPRLLAGDAIDFSGGAGKSTGPKGGKGDEERLKSLQKSSSPFILRDGAPPDSRPSINNPRDSREERRQRLAREERKYFLLYEPGELQKKEREGSNTGLGDYSLGAHDEKYPGRNWLSDDASSSSPTAANKAAANRKDNRSEDVETRARQADDEENERKKSDRTGLFGQTGRESQAVPGAAKDADFKDLLNSSPGRSEPASSFDKADFTLRDILGVQETSRGRAQETRMDSFRQMLNGTPGSSALNPSKDPARFPGVTPPADRAFDGFGKAGGRDAFSPTPAGTDIGNKLRSPVGDNPYQRPSPFQNANPSGFSPSDPSKQRVQPVDFESLKKRVR